MRLFIAIDFNEIKDYFIKLQNQLPKNARLSLVKSFHLTLKFLGEVQPIKTENVKEELKKIKFYSFLVFLNGIGVFPSEDYIRVVWVGLKPENEILELQKNIDEKLKKLFKKEKNFKAHITLARVKFIDDKEKFISKLKKIKIQNKKIGINNFKLIRSTLSPEGAIYETIETF